MIHSEYRHEINCNSQHHQRDANESNRQGKHSLQVHHGDTEKPSSITAALSFLRVSAVNSPDEIRFSERSPFVSRTNEWVFIYRSVDSVFGYGKYIIQPAADQRGPQFVARFAQMQFIVDKEIRAWSSVGEKIVAGRGNEVGIRGRQRDLSQSSIDGSYFRPCVEASLAWSDFDQKHG